MSDEIPHNLNHLDTLVGEEPAVAPTDEAPLVETMAGALPDAAAPPTAPVNAAAALEETLEQPTTDTTAEGAAETQEEKVEQQQPPKKRRKTYARKDQPRWSDMFYQLTLFKIKNGHCKVGKNDDEILYQWCVNQRRFFHYMRHPKARPSVDPNRLTPDRELVLNSLGFEWTVLNAENENRWEKRFQELLAWKEVNGHCNVPQNCPLGKWVKMQREQKNEADLVRAGGRRPGAKGRPCMPPARQRKLESIGMQWRLANVVGWDKRYKQLQEYHAKNGHVHVPQSYPPDKSFGRWVMKQRSEYSLRLRGKKNQLTDERIANLEALGFAWVAPHIQKLRDSPKKRKRDGYDDEEEEEDEIPNVATAPDFNYFPAAAGTAPHYSEPPAHTHQQQPQTTCAPEYSV